MHRFVEKFSSSPFQMPLESGAVDMCGKWDAAQDLAFPTFDIPDVHNVCSHRHTLSHLQLQPLFTSSRMVLM